MLWPVDRATMALVWHARLSGARRLSRLPPPHRAPPPGARQRRRAVRPPGRRCVRTRADAADFVGRVRERVAAGGTCVVALDTELLGHWWYEGVAWLAGGDRCRRAGRAALTTLDDALERAAIRSRRRPGCRRRTWGEGGDLRTWSGPAVAELAWRARTLELRTCSGGWPARPRALRELLALQSSDWAFLVTRALAGRLPARAGGPATRRQLERALAGEPLEPSSAAPGPGAGGVGVGAPRLAPERLTPSGTCAAPRASAAAARGRRRRLRCPARRR